jgi:hypothetical protein
MSRVRGADLALRNTVRRHSDRGVDASKLTSRISTTFLEINLQISITEVGGTVLA